ncbi:TPA: hydrogenase maturation protein [Bacillus cereus]|nr:hydrogenase maturation protein [Bacillus cereus]
MKILFITTSHNSMSQRMFVELTDREHEVKIHIATNEYDMIEAVQDMKPDLIICPFLKTAIPEEIWKNNLCIIVHPGIVGDRGPSSLDWAITEKRLKWGVTLLQANHEMDAGDIWSTKNFIMNNKTKSALYRNEVTQAAVTCLLNTIKKFQSEKFSPVSLNYDNPEVNGKLHVPMKQVHRKINWSDPTEDILTKIRAADSNPGVLDTIFDQEYYLYGAYEESDLRGKPGDIIGKRDESICRATGDGAIWITHLKPRGYFKIPATLALKNKLNHIPTYSLTPFEKFEGDTYREIYYEEKNKVGYLHFNFYNGAMSTEQCMRLREALINIKQRDINVLILMGGEDFWSNGIHLNTIEHNENPADESWRNINAMNDLILEILSMDSKIIISALQGNAGAGGVTLALAADYIYARHGVVLNPYYKKMGGLFGSEYWTYLLPKRVGSKKAYELTEKCLPISTETAKSIGLLDDVFGQNTLEFIEQITLRSEDISNSSKLKQLIIKKNEDRKNDEEYKPLSQYRKEELKRMWGNFYGPDKSYHIARHNFVYKISCLNYQPLSQV